MGLEKDIQIKISRWLNYHKIPFLKTQGGITYTKQGQIRAFKKGFSDLIVFYQNTPYFIELKQDGKLLRDSQIEAFIALKNVKFDSFYIITPSIYGKWSKDKKNKNFETLIWLAKRIKITFLDNNSYLISGNHVKDYIYKLK